MSGRGRYKNICSFCGETKAELYRGPRRRKQACPAICEDCIPLALEQLTSPPDKLSLEDMAH